MRLTSESVLEGHPDKVCDQISDAILDAYLRRDKEARVAVEALISHQLLVIAGEVRSEAKISVEEIAKQVLAEIGYDSLEKGFDYHSCVLIQQIHHQSSDIALGLDQAGGQLGMQGAGDQGIMYGYACDETEDYLPLPIYYAHLLAKKITQLRKEGKLAYLYPDGKTQVTVEYDEKGRPVELTDIVLSVQHHADISQEELTRDLKHWVIEPLLPPYLLKEKTRILINPTGRFVIGGPQGDTGLTGRKIIVDTYGGVVPHGGGAFSGKDPSKVDRSAAYMARYIAKNLVAAGLAKRCQVVLSYAIGVVDPVSVSVDSFGTSHLSNRLLARLVQEVFDLTPRGIIQHLKLLQPLYQQTAAYGHFKSGLGLPWEEVDQVSLLQEIERRLRS